VCCRHRHSGEPAGTCAGISHQTGHVHHTRCGRQQPGRGDARRRDRLTQIWKQQIVVLNRPGAGGLIAAQAAAAVEKDGYSLYVAQASTFTVLPIEQEGKLPVNLQTAFAPIGMVGEQPIALSVNKDVPVSNVVDLIALANKTPDGMLFGATNRRWPITSHGRTVPRAGQGQYFVCPCCRGVRVAQ
jgi:Uncharacterized protein conserved in bacteria